MNNVFDWISEINAFIPILVGFITTAVGAFLAVKNFIKVLKTKNKAELWSMIMSAADAAMKEAEQCGINGVAKKEMVINTIKASCEAAGLDIKDFLDAISVYIDQTIKFVNDMADKKCEK